MTDGRWEPTTERLRSCYDEIVRLNALIVDLENLEDMESDGLVLHKAPVELAQFTRGICDNFEHDLAEKGLTLTVEGAPLTIGLDSNRFGSVVTNLVSNAIKYTPEKGAIDIQIHDAGELALLIIDNDGEGIPEDELPAIFERFYRADKSRNRGTGGTGLGLAIVKSIVTAHGGTISAQNKPQGGVRFIVTLRRG
jgi:signal transduction histidine kinase